MKTTRRNIALTLAGAPFILRGQQVLLRARIKVDTERVIGDIDPLTYGISSNIWAAASMAASSTRRPLSDPNGYRRLSTEPALPPCIMARKSASWKALHGAAAVNNRG